MKRPVSKGPPADDCDADLRLGTALFSHLPFADAMGLARRVLVGDTEPAHGFLETFAGRKGNLDPGARPEASRCHGGTPQSSGRVVLSQPDINQSGFAGAIQPRWFALREVAICVTTEHSLSAPKA